jgi:NADH:ubiquinone oxidoreductase subunit 3 (subunit A)
MIFFIHIFLQKERRGEESEAAPLERGLVRTGKVCTVFSLQFFIFLILLVVLDLEVVFVVGLVFGSPLAV